MAISASDEDYNQFSDAINATNSPVSGFNWTSAIIIQSLS